MPPGKMGKRAGERGRERGKPRGFRRDRDCVTCKQRGLKCDLNRPQCRPCVEAGLLCGGYPLRVVWAEQRRRASIPAATARARAAASANAAVEITEAADRPLGSSASPESRPPALASPGEAEPWSATDQNSLLKRLAALCSHILTTEDAGAEASSRQRQALSPETVRLLSDLCVFIQARLEGGDAPAAASSLHDDGESASAGSLDMVRHRLAALANLNRAIEAANPFAFLGIATFAVFEVCDTTFGEWKCHLYGARYVLDHHRCRSMADVRRLSRLVPGLLDILARLVWFDISGTVVRIVRGAGAGAALIFDDWHRQLLDGAFFRTIGCPPDTCALYVDVAKARIAQDPVRSCLRVTEQVLRLQPAARHEPAAWDVCASVNRCAAALAALALVPHAAAVLADSREATMAAVAERLCGLLAATPSSSPFYIHMALGAYLAGMHARTAEQCRTVRQYWLNCSLAGISRYPGGLARCEEHWRSVGLLAGSATEGDSPL